MACPDSQGSDAALQIESDQVNMSFHNIPAARQAQLTITAVNCQKFIIVIISFQLVSPNVVITMTCLSI